jgi:predicted transglutaminase-like cysteine proteinase
MIEILREVNFEVNKLPYKADWELYSSSEFWEKIGPQGGDCEDFALGKYYKLLEKGIPPEKLRLATCYVETGEYHCVLLADDETTTWVLDNRYAYPTEYYLLPYKWDKFQIAGSNKWEKA